MIAANLRYLLKFRLKGFELVTPRRSAFKNVKPGEAPLFAVEHQQNSFVTPCEGSLITFPRASLTKRYWANSEMEGSFISMTGFDREDTHEAKPVL